MAGERRLGELAGRQAEGDAGRQVGQFVSVSGFRLKQQQPEPGRICHEQLVRPLPAAFIKPGQAQFAVIGQLRVLEHKPAVQAGQAGFLERHDLARYGPHVAAPQGERRPVQQQAPLVTELFEQLARLVLKAQVLGGVTAVPGYVGRLFGSLGAQCQVADALAFLDHLDAGVPCGSERTLAHVQHRHVLDLLRLYGFVAEPLGQLARLVQMLERLVVGAQALSGRRQVVQAGGNRGQVTGAPRHR